MVDETKLASDFSSQEHTKLEDNESLSKDLRERNCKVRILHKH